jgi:SOS response regulatory protein OraA/RecX
MNEKWDAFDPFAHMKFTKLKYAAKIAAALVRRGYDDKQVSDMAIKIVDNLFSEVDKSFNKS